MFDIEIGHFVAHAAMIWVIIALLRQLNREREERDVSQKMYRELALRVRVAQLDEEVTSHMDPVEYFHARQREADRRESGLPSTVSDVEGV